MLWFAGAGIAQHVFDEMKELAIQTCGERILFLTGLGSTETAPCALGAHLGERARRQYGPAGARLELKLVPMRGQARSARARAQHHARLLARSPN